MMISCYVDDITFRKLVKLSGQLGRSVLDLAESAISNEVSQAMPDSEVLPPPCYMPKDEEIAWHRDGHS